MWGRSSCYLVMIASRRHLVVVSQVNVISAFYRLIGVDPVVWWWFFLAFAAHATLLACTFHPHGPFFYGEPSQVRWHWERSLVAWKVGSYSELCFINSMLERDAHVYVYQWYLMYLHAFNLLFVLYYHYVYERGRSSKTMIPGPILAIRKVLCYFAYCFSFSSYIEISQKYYSFRSKI
jgi:hypothetical protein